MAAKYGGVGFDVHQFIKQSFVVTERYAKFVVHLYQGQGL